MSVCKKAHKCITDLNDVGTNSKTVNKFHKLYEHYRVYYKFSIYIFYQLGAAFVKLTHTTVGNQMYLYINYFQKRWLRLYRLYY